MQLAPSFFRLQRRRSQAASAGRALVWLVLIVAASAAGSMAQPRPVGLETATSRERPPSGRAAALHRGSPVAGGRETIPRVHSEELARWPAGPVRYLLSGPETRLFKSLSDDIERRAFIKQFWLRRDPKIDTFENEYRFDFWKRVFEANQLFTRTTVPGWRSDRGKFYIMLGPPDQIETENMPGRRGGIVMLVPNQDGGSTGRVFGADLPSQSFLGLERWTYRSRPSARLSPNFVLAFQLTSAGDYELSTDARDWTLFMNSYSELVGPVDGAEPFGLTSPQQGEDFLQLYNDVAVALDYGTINRVPDPEELLGELVTSEEFFGAIPFLLQVDYYKTETEATLAVFTLGVESRALFAGTEARPADLMAVGKLESLEEPGRTTLLAGSDALSAAPDNREGGLLLFQVVKPVRPGSYNATFGIMDRNDRRIGSRRESIRVPVFPSGGLTLSTLALARSLQPVDDGIETAAAPFRLGNYRVVPKTEPRFTNGEDFALYYQVYGAAEDPRTGHLRLDVDYRFFVLQDGDFVPIGEPIHVQDRDRAVQGWSFPLAGWPDATFRLEVTVTDAISGEVAVGHTIFGIGSS